MCATTPGNSYALTGTFKGATKQSKSTDVVSDLPVALPLSKDNVLASQIIVSSGITLD